MARQRRKSNDEETTYWLSYSDMMAALLLIFVLFISFTMLQAKKQYEAEQMKLLEQELALEEKENAIVQYETELASKETEIASQKEVMEAQEQRITEIVGVKTDLINDLKEEFEGGDMDVSIDPQTGAITFDSNILFDLHQYTLKTTGKDFLKEFFPRYLEILMDPKYNEYISEIIIEGHADPSGMYILSLELSQQRALEVAKYCLDDDSAIVPDDELEELRKIITANGRSYSDPIYYASGAVNYPASRRVEIKFRLKDEDLVEEMIQILAEEEL